MSKFKTSKEDVSTNIIIRVAVEKLFGQYSYDIPNPDNEYPGLSRLLILYGDNGSGKTTILKLIYNLLTTAIIKPSNVFVAEQKFNRFSIYLADGTIVSAEREGDMIEGGYRYVIKKGTETLTSVFFEIGHEPSTPKNKEFVENERKKLLSVLLTLNINLYFLSDERKILGIAEDIEEEESNNIIYTRSGRYITSSIGRWGDGPPGLPLELAIAKAVKWIKDRVLKSSSLGEASANTIYTEVVKTISRLTKEKIPSEKEIGNFINNLNDLAKRSEAFSDLGLMYPLDTKAIIHAIEGAPSGVRIIIYRILKPYIDGIEARLNALNEIKDLISSFVTNINNKFFVDKKVNFDIAQGLFITSNTGSIITPKMLSSGEKQLLLLFCNTLTAQEQSCIFIIDEPEISLNVKWQRQLIKALLSLVHTDRVQFILATHSIEILAQFKKNVVRLIAKE